MKEKLYRRCDILSFFSITHICNINNNSNVSCVSYNAVALFSFISDVRHLIIVSTCSLCLFLVF